MAAAERLGSWATVFEEAGFTALTPGWPDDPETVEEANAHPEVFAHKTVGQVADHYDEIIRGLNKGCVPWDQQRTQLPLTCNRELWSQP